MSAQVDTTTKLSYLLPTGTFLTFQVLAPLATNNGHCGRTEQIVTAVALTLLVAGCIATSFTDSYTAPDGKVYNGFLTSRGLWVPGYGTTAAPLEQAPEPGASSEDRTQNRNKRDDHDYIRGPLFKPLPADYINAALSAIAFLTLTMFTDPLSSCFYPHLSETVLKTLPVLLATVLSFCCSFVTKVRQGYGNSVVPRTIPAQVRESSKTTANANPIETPDVTTTRRVDNVLRMASKIDAAMI